MQLDKATVVKCKDVVSERLRIVREQRNKFEKLRGMKIYPSPFKQPDVYAHTAAEWFDIFSECHEHLKAAHDDIQVLEQDAVDERTDLKDFATLDKFIAENFPKEVEASEGRSSALIAISLIHRMASSLQKTEKPAKNK